MPTWQRVIKPFRWHRSGGSTYLGNSRCWNTLEYADEQVSVALSDGRENSTDSGGGDAETVGTDQTTRKNRRKRAARPKLLPP